MKARLGSLSPRVLTAISVAAVLLFAAASWLLVVSPKRAEASKLGDEVAAAETRLAVARSAAERPKEPSLSVSDVLKLSKAMPTSRDQASLLLELTELAAESGVVLRSVAPGTATEVVGEPTAVPVTLAVTGTYFQITRFLRLTRGLTGLRGDRIKARGRLLSVRGVELRESAEGGFPRLDGTLTVNAYVYDGPIVPPPPPTLPKGDGEEPTTSAAGSSS